MDKQTTSPMLGEAEPDLEASREGALQVLGRIANQHVGTPSPERFAAAEQLMSNLVERTERGLAELRIEPRDQRRPGSCNLIPGILMYCAHCDAQQSGYELQAQAYQVNDLHRAAARRTPAIDDERAERDSFYHAFNVITVNGYSFLADLTFAQFRGPDDRIREQALDTSIAFSTNELAGTLVAAGYVPLTDENLREYLRITSAINDHAYLKGVTAAILSTVAALDMERFVDEKEDGLTPQLGAKA